MTNERTKTNLWLLQWGDRMALLYCWNRLGLCYRCQVAALMESWKQEMIRHVVVCCCWILHHYKGGAWRVCLWLLLSGQSFSEIKSLDYFGFFRWLNCSLINFCVLLSSSQHLHACICIKHCNWLQFILPQDCLYLLKSLLVCSWATRGRGSAACGLSLPEVVHLANVLFYLISTQQRVHKKHRGRKNTVEIPLCTLPLCAWHNFYIIRL